MEHRFWNCTMRIKYNLICWRWKSKCNADWEDIVHLFMDSFHSVGNKTKGWISKRVFQENKARPIFRKTNISYPVIRTRTRTYQGLRNVRFSENLACFVFLKHPFWDSPSCLITGDMPKYTKQMKSCILK